MLCIYVAGPMTGIYEFNTPAFIEAARRLRGLGHGVHTPVEADLGEGFDWTGVDGSLEHLRAVGFDRTAAMRRNYKVLAEWANAIAFLPGWAQSKGSLAELIAADELGLQLFEYRPVDPARPLIPFDTEPRVEISTVRYKVPVT